MAGHCSIAPHPTEQRVLLVREEGGWSLPRHETEDAEAIRALMRQRYGLETTLLGVYAGHYLDVEHDDPTCIFALETHASATPVPDGARWMGRSEMAEASLTDEQRVTLERWFAEAETGDIPLERAPWERPGWFAAASSWIERQVAGLGWQPTGAIVQVHARGWSSVLRQPTTGGTLYFKAVTADSGFETPLTALLAELMPAQTPPVLARDAERFWLLMSDAGESVRGHIRETGDPRPYEEALVAFARFQQALLPHTERLAATGCPDHRLHRLPALFDDLLRDTDGLLLERPGGLSAAEYGQLRALDVAGMARRLVDFGIPETLHQEDCHPGHWVAGASGSLFIDWGDSCLSHPFFSLMMALRWARLVLEYDAATLDRLRDAYLAQWGASGAYGSLERLREAYALAWQLAPLTRALTWHRGTAAQEPAARWQYADAAPYWLRLFLLGETSDG